jgi:hypothetical protein
MILTDRDKDLVFDEKFFRKLSKLVGKYLLYGVPPKDNKGHYEQITFRIDPAMIDVFNKLKTMLPDQWFKKKMELKRNLFSMAVIIAIEVLENMGDGDYQELEEVKKTVNILNEIETIIRRKALDHRINIVKQEVESVTHSKKIISLMEKLDKQIELGDRKQEI